MFHITGTRNRSAVVSGDELCRTVKVYVAIGEGDAERPIRIDGNDLPLIHQPFIGAAPPGSAHALANHYRTTHHVQLLHRRPSGPWPRSESDDGIGDCKEKRATPTVNKERPCGREACPYIGNFFGGGGV